MGFIESSYNYCEYKLKDMDIIPIVIPSYMDNRLSTIKYINGSKFRTHANIFLFVRESEYHQYIDSIKNFEDLVITVIPMEDDKVLNTGCTRRYIINYLKYNSEFSTEFTKFLFLDDDLRRLDIPYIENPDPMVILEMWFMLSKFLKLDMCGIQPTNNIHKMKDYDYNGKLDRLASINKSFGFSFTYVDLNIFKKTDLNYKDTTISGHEDIYIVADLLKNGGVYGKLNFIFSHYNAYDKKKWNNMDRDDRLKLQADTMMESENSKYFILSRSGLGVSLNWKLLNEEFFSDSIESLREEVNNSIVTLNNSLKLFKVKDYESLIRRVNHE